MFIIENVYKAREKSLQTQIPSKSLNIQISLQIRCFLFTISYQLTSSQVFHIKAASK